MPTWLAHRVKQRINGECSDVTRAASHAACGPYDNLDIFHAQDVEMAMSEPAALGRTVELLHVGS